MFAKYLYYVGNFHKFFFLSRKFSQLIMEIRKRETGGKRREGTGMAK